LTKNTEQESYEFIRAHADCGELRWEYKLESSDVVGRMKHDEDIEDWSDDDIKQVTEMMLGIPEDQVDKIEVIWH
jgi:hypothetical protein